MQPAKQLRERSSDADAAHGVSLDDFGKIGAGAIIGATAFEVMGSKLLTGYSWAWIVLGAAIGAIVQRLVIRRAEKY
jgi:hypothetical protein